MDEFPLSRRIFQQMFVLIVKIIQSILCAFFNDILPYCFGKIFFGAEMIMDGSFGNASFFRDPFQLHAVKEIFAGDMLDRCRNDFPARL